MNNTNARSGSQFDISQSRFLSKQPKEEDSSDPANASLIEEGRTSGLEVRYQIPPNNYIDEFSSISKPDEEDEQDRVFETEYEASDITFTPESKQRRFITEYDMSEGASTPESKRRFSTDTPFESKRSTHASRRTFMTKDSEDPTVSSVCDFKTAYTTSSASSDPTASSAREFQTDYSQSRPSRDPTDTSERKFKTSYSESKPSFDRTPTAGRKFKTSFTESKPSCGLTDSPDRKFKTSYTESKPSYGHTDSPDRKFQTEFSSSQPATHSPTEDRKYKTSYTETKPSITSSDRVFETSAKRSNTTGQKYNFETELTPSEKNSVELPGSHNPPQFRVTDNTSAKTSVREFETEFSATPSQFSEAIPCESAKRSVREFETEFSTTPSAWAASIPSEQLQLASIPNESHACATNLSDTSGTDSHSATSQRVFACDSSSHATSQPASVVSYPVLANDKSAQPTSQSPSVVLYPAFTSESSAQPSTHTFQTDSISSPSDLDQGSATSDPKIQPTSVAVNPAPFQQAQVIPSLFSSPYTVTPDARVPKASILKSLQKTNRIPAIDDTPSVASNSMRSVHFNPQVAERVYFKDAPEPVKPTQDAVASSHSSYYVTPSATDSQMQEHSRFENTGLTLYSNVSGISTNQAKQMRFETTGPKFSPISSDITPAEEQKLRFENTGPHFSPNQSLISRNLIEDFEASKPIAEEMNNVYQEPVSPDSPITPSSPSDLESSKQQSPSIPSVTAGESSSWNSQYVTPKTEESYKYDHSRFETTDPRRTSNRQFSSNSPKVDLSIGEDFVATNPIHQETAYREPVTPDSPITPLSPSDVDESSPIAQQISGIASAASRGSSSHQGSQVQSTHFEAPNTPSAIDTSFGQPGTAYTSQMSGLPTAVSKDYPSIDNTPKQSDSSSQSHVYSHTISSGYPKSHSDHRSEHINSVSQASSRMMAPESSPKVFEMNDCGVSSISELSSNYSQQSVNLPTSEAKSVTHLSITPNLGANSIIPTDRRFTPPAMNAFGVSPISARSSENTTNLSKSPKLVGISNTASQAASVLISPNAENDSIQAASERFATPQPEQRAPQMNEYGLSSISGNPFSNFTSPPAAQNAFQMNEFGVSSGSEISSGSQVSASRSATSPPNAGNAFQMNQCGVSSVSGMSPITSEQISTAGISMQRHSQPLSSTNQSVESSARMAQPTSLSKINLSAVTKTATFGDTAEKQSSISQPVTFTRERRLSNSSQQMSVGTATGEEQSKNAPVIFPSPEEVKIHPTSSPERQSSERFLSNPTSATPHRNFQTPATFSDIQTPMSYESPLHDSASPGFGNTPFSGLKDKPNTTDYFASNDGFLDSTAMFQQSMAEPQSQTGSWPMPSESESEGLPYRERNPFDDFSRMDFGNERVPQRKSEKTVAPQEEKKTVAAKPKAHKKTEPRSSAETEPSKIFVDNRSTTARFAELYPLRNRCVNFASGNREYAVYDKDMNLQYIAQPQKASEAVPGKTQCTGNWNDPVTQSTTAYTAGYAGKDLKYKAWDKGGVVQFLGPKDNPMTDKLIKLAAKEVYQVTTDGHGPLWITMFRGVKNGCQFTLNNEKSKLLSIGMNIHIGAGQHVRFENVAKRAIVIMEERYQFSGFVNMGTSSLAK